MGRAYSIGSYKDFSGCYSSANSGDDSLLIIYVRCDIKAEVLLRFRQVKLNEPKEHVLLVGIVLVPVFGWPDDVVAKIRVRFLKFYQRYTRV